MRVYALAAAAKSTAPSILHKSATQKVRVRHSGKSANSNPLLAMARYHHRDGFHRKAEVLGLPSRAAFKLEELLARFKLLSEGGRVIDLGCAPGGWLSILARTVGSRGRIVGIDLAPC